MSVTSSSALPRQVADAYVDALIELDPITGSYLGVRASHALLPDFSPQDSRPWPTWRARRSPASTRPSGSPAATAMPNGAAAASCGSG